jgi:putative drug exporter of the RND superfamily
MIAALASWCYRRRRTVVILWVTTLVGLTVIASTFGAEHRVDYSMPGSESAAVRDLLGERYPERPGDSAFLVARSQRGIESPGFVEALAVLVADLAALDHVVSVEAPIPAPDGLTVLAEVVLDDRAEALPPDAVHALIDRTKAANGGDLAQFELGGWPIQNVEIGAAGKEGIGLAAAVIILLVAFGSALAAGIPIVLALVGLGVGSALAMLVAHLVDVPEWGAMLAAMIGIGVGIDYALFIVTRYRNALADGAEPADAVALAMTTSGRAVLFAGGTVVLSLLGLGITGLEYMWGAAFAMVLAVLGVLATAMTLLPAVLGFAGRKIDRLRIPGVRDRSAHSARWAAWSRRVQRRPALHGAVGVAVLVALALPTLGLRFGFPDAGSNPTSQMSRRAFDLTAEAFGPGANGPLVLTVTADAERLPAATHAVLTALSSDLDVVAALPGPVAAGGGTQLVNVIPAAGPQDEATESLVRRLRGEAMPAVSAATGADVLVGGITALLVDEADYEAARLPWFIGAVLVLSFALLIAVFRAPLVALKAVVLNLLGIAAAYGVIAMAVQGGWLGRLVGIPEATPVPVFVPILMFALLFGLSMDYEVFLLSRIREAHQRGASNSDAVVEGLATTARVITAAAAIMVVVFGAFVLNDEVIAKLAGLGLATAVFLDATLVRMVLVPATMELLGEGNWWMPRWLDRRLPHLDVEGAHPAPTLVEPVPVAVAVGD